MVAAILASVLFSLGFCTFSLTAQVIEIDEAGAVTRHDGPAVYRGDGVSPRPIVAVETAPVPRAGPTRPLPAVMQAISASAARHGVSPDLVYVLAWHESRFRQDAVSHKGAIGVMQLMPDTARASGVDPYDLEGNVEGGVKILAQLLRQYGGDLVKTLAAYDAGPGAVARYRGMPPYRETRAYVADIFEQLARLSIPMEAKR